MRGIKSASLIDFIYWIGKSNRIVAFGKVFIPAEEAEEVEEDDGHDDQGRKEESELVGEQETGENNNQVQEASSNSPIDEPETGVRFPHNQEETTEDDDIIELPSDDLSPQAISKELVPITGKPQPVCSYFKQNQCGVPTNSRKPRSAVWGFFQIDMKDSEKVVCGMCNARIFHGVGRRATTTSMIKHLSNKHDIKLHQEKSDSSIANNGNGNQSSTCRQVDLKTAFEGLKSWNFNEKKSKEMRKLIAEMLVVDNLPFSFVDNPGFRRLMARAVPKFSMPSRPYMSETAVPKILNRVTAKIQKLVNEASFISFTSDIWTSENNRAFITLSGHWIDKVFEQKHFLLSLEHFPESHTSENIKQILLKMLSDWNIPKEKVHVVVRYSDEAKTLASIATCRQVVIEAS